MTARHRSLEPHAGSWTRNGDDPVRRELARIEDEVRAALARIDQLEEEVAMTLNAIAADRFREYR